MRRFVLLAAWILAVAACGSQEPTATTQAEEATATTIDHSEHTATAATDAANADPDEATIEISGFAFNGPPTVSVGDTVRIVNDDSAPHTWSAEDGPFDVSVAPGESATYTFEEAGEFDYFCRIHPSMTGSITVQE